VAPIPARQAVNQPAPVAVPSPEDLGVSASRPESTGVDWNLIHRRFREAGASCVQVEHLPQGNCRFNCVLATTTPERNHRIEVEAATEAETARLALARLDDWMTTGKK
jgi:hypothetical protein